MISREKCLEWLGDADYEAIGIEFLEALINRAYQEAIKDAAQILKTEAERLDEIGTYEDDVEYLKKLAGSIRNLGD